MTTEKLLEFTQQISKMLAHKNKFSIYDYDDISQEIYLLVNKASTKYDPAKGDEFQFIYHFVVRRLITLKRDKQMAPKSKFAEAKMKVYNTTQLQENHRVIDNIHSIFEDYNDLISLIDKKIPANLRLNYLRMLEGVEMSFPEKNKVIESIKKIIEINGAKE